jgi:hypothetical protein
MRSRASGKMAVILMFLPVACGTPPAPPSSKPAEPGEPKPPALVNSGKVVIHVKDMTKVLNLV